MCRMAVVSFELTSGPSTRGSSSAVALERPVRSSEGSATASSWWSTCDATRARAADQQIRDFERCHATTQPIFVSDFVDPFRVLKWRRKSCVVVEHRCFLCCELERQIGVAGLWASSVVRSKAHRRADPRGLLVRAAADSPSGFASVLTRRRSGRGGVVRRFPEG